MKGEVHDADEVHGWEVEGSRSGGHLLLDGESGVEHRPFIEELLMGQLHLNDKAGAVGVSAFHIDPDPLAVGEGIDVLLRGILE